MVPESFIYDKNEAQERLFVRDQGFVREVQQVQEWRSSSELDISDQNTVSVEVLEASAPSVRPRSVPKNFVHDLFHRPSQSPSEYERKMLLFESRNVFFFLS